MTAHLIFIVVLFPLAGYLFVAWRGGLLRPAQALLRAFAAALLLLTLTAGGREGRVASPAPSLVLLDDSESMTLPAGEGSRAEEAAAWIEAGRAGRVIPFGSTLFPQDASDRRQTSVARALWLARRLVHGLRQVVLVSDGQSTEPIPRDLIAAYRRAQVPIHVKGLGRPIPHDWELIGGVAPPTVRAGEPLEITLFVQTFREGESLEVSVAGKLAKRVHVPQAGLRSVTAATIPAEPGRQTFTVRVSGTERHEEQGFSVRVLPRKEPLVLVCGRPHPECAALYRYLRLFRDFQVSLWVEGPKGYLPHASRRLFLAEELTAASLVGLVVPTCRQARQALAAADAQAPVFILLGEASLVGCEAEFIGRSGLLRLLGRPVRPEGSPSAPPIPAGVELGSGFELPITGDSGGAKVALAALRADGGRRLALVTSDRTHEWRMKPAGRRAYELFWEELVRLLQQKWELVVPPGPWVAHLPLPIILAGSAEGPAPIEGEVTGASGTIPLLLAPAEGGYVASVSLAAGDYTVQVREPIARAARITVLPSVPETKPPTANHERLAQLAAATGGNVLAEAPPKPPVGTSLIWVTHFSTLAALLFLLVALADWAGKEEA